MADTRNGNTGKPEEKRTSVKFKKAQKNSGSLRDMKNGKKSKPGTKKVKIKTSEDKKPEEEFITSKAVAEEGSLRAMANRTRAEKAEAEKAGKRPKKLRKTLTLAPWICVIIVLAALSVSILIRNSGIRSYKTITAISGTNYDIIETDCFVLRQEELVEVNSDGAIVPIVSDGEKVTKGQIVANKFTSADSAAAYSELLTADSDLAYYDILLNRSPSGNIDGAIETAREDIASAVFAITDAVYKNNLGVLHDAKNSLAAAYVSYRRATDGSVNFTQRLDLLNEKRAELEKKVGSYTGSEAPLSGFFSFGADGFEGIGGYDMAEEMTVEKAEALLNAVPTNIKSSGKIVTDSSWYIVCIVEKEAAQKYLDQNGTALTYRYIDGLCRGVQNGRRQTTLFFPSSTDKPVKASLVSFIQGSDERFCFVFRAIGLGEDTINLRKETLQIVVKSYENSYRIPKSALSSEVEMIIDEDGHITGESKIDVVIYNRRDERKVNICYYDGDYVIVDNPTDSKDYIGPDEEVII